MPDKPLIGVMPLFDFEKDSYWMLPGYLDLVSEAGGIPLTLSLSTNAGDLEQIADTCDGFLFTGGHDIEPQRYQQQGTHVQETWPQRDAMELELLRLAKERRLPFLGICRGLQMVNVFHGGTLWQDLPALHPSTVVHSQKHPYDHPSHTVRLAAGSLIARSIGHVDGCEALPVNSCHHQAIDRLGDGLIAAAWSPDGLVEGVEVEAYPFGVAVQWHPEFFGCACPESISLFSAFVRACKAGA